MKNQYFPLSLHPSNSPKGENWASPQYTINLTIRMWQFKRNRAMVVSPLRGQGVCDRQLGQLKLQSGDRTVEKYYSTGLQKNRGTVTKQVNRSVDNKSAERLRPLQRSPSVSREDDSSYSGLNAQEKCYECGIKSIFLSKSRRLNFCTGVNLLLMRMQKFKTTTSLATKMLFRLGSILKNPILNVTQKYNPKRYIGLELLIELQSEETLNNFFLAGGMSLALQIGHRQFVDLDLFTTDDFDVGQ